MFCICVTEQGKTESIFLKAWMYSDQLDRVRNFCMLPRMIHADNKTPS